MKCIVALSSLALVSLSGVSPCLAANQALGRSPTQSSSSQSLPSTAKTIQIAGFGLNDVIRAIDRGRDVAEQEKRRQEERERRERLEQERREREAAKEQERQQRVEAYQQQQKERQAAEEARRAADQFSTQTPSPSTGNSSQNISGLNKRDNETHEQWYRGIDPVILRMPGAEYRAWKATLSVQDRKAYDAITRRKNREAADTLNRAIPEIIRDAAESQNPANRPQECWRPDGRGNWHRC